MKKILTLTFLIGGLTGAWAQGTLQFDVNLDGANEVPPTDSTRIGMGIGTGVTLNGTTLDYSIGFSATTDIPTDVTINGPAGTDSTAPILFDLGAPSYYTGFNPPLLSWSVTGMINNLTGAQISDLENGLWYVNFFSSSSSYPDGEIRGQITPVPEPSDLALLGLGIGSISLWCRRKRPLKRYRSFCSCWRVWQASKRKAHSSSLPTSMEAMKRHPTAACMLVLEPSRSMETA